MVTRLVGLSSGLDTLVREDYGFHSSPLKLAAVKLRHFFEACETLETVRLQKEVREYDLARRVMPWPGWLPLPLLPF